MTQRNDRPLPLKDAPLLYAPHNEMGVVFLFAGIARRLQMRIEEIRAAYPDCIAYRLSGDAEKRVRIEFEFRSSSFKAHRHDPAQCDCIVCWHHDWPDAPRRIEVIELKKFFTLPPKVWIQCAVKSQQAQLDSEDRLTWALSPHAAEGDLLLMYRGYPACKITDVYRVVSSKLWRGKASWRAGEAFFGIIQRVCALESPISLGDLRDHRALSAASFVRRNMQGKGLSASEQWPYLYSMICGRNPSAREALAVFAPENIWAAAAGA